jgi:hypothetical protein
VDADGEARARSAMTRDEKIRNSPEYLGALLELTFRATVNAPPLFDQIDIAEIENDPNSFCLYAYRRSDGECFIKSFTLAPARKRKTSKHDR